MMCLFISAKSVLCGGFRLAKGFSIPNRSISFYRTAKELQYLYSNVILYYQLLHIGFDMGLQATVNVIILPDGRMDRKNAARYTGLSEKTLAMHACRGTGPAFVKRGKVFYFKEDLDRWIREGKWSSTA
jgi:hypothetical protein